jgi:hypothetical protein
MTNPVTPSEPQPRRDARRTAAGSTAARSKGRLARAVVAALVVVAGAAAVVWSYLESRESLERESEREKPVRAAARVASGTGVIHIDDDAQRASGIATKRLSATAHPEELRAYGMVLDVARLTELGNAYANAEAQARTAQARIAFSQAAYERARMLHDNDGGVSQAALQAAEATFRTDEAGAAAAVSMVRTLAATARQEWGPVLGKSLVERSETVVRLIERQDFLLQVTLRPGVPPPKSIVAAAIARDGEDRTAITLVSPATRTDPRIQGVSLFFLAPGDSGVLPGMNVRAVIATGDTRDGIAVPSEALVWWQDRPWVYRVTDDDTFVRTAVATDLPTPDGGYIDRTLGRDAEIVTHGAQLLLSEEFRAQIQVGEDGQ